MKTFSVRLIIGVSTFLVGVCCVAVYLFEHQSDELNENALKSPVEIREAEPIDLFELRDKPPTRQEFIEQIKKGCKPNDFERLPKSDVKLSDEFEFERRQDDYESLKKAQLPPDSLAIRIWAGGGLAKSRVFSLERHSDAWTAWQLKYSFDKRSQKFVKQKQSLEPRSDWNVVWTKLENEQILNLPDAAQIGAVKMWEDGKIVFIETYQNGNYRDYAYSMPRFVCAEEARKVARIGDIINSEFNINLY